MSKIGYVRVSSIDQNEQRQVEALEKLGMDRVFAEKVSGKNMNGRPQLKALLDYVREGDVIYVADLSRLARNTRDLLQLIEDLTEKGIGLVSLKENIDTSTATGKLMITMLGAIAEFERANLLERQREGIELAKRKGVYKGRKSIEKPDNWTEVYQQYLTRKISGAQAMDILKLKRNTFYKFAAEERGEK